MLINKRYEIFCELLVRYPENTSCVQTVLHVINKTIKFRKEDCKELINYILFNMNYEEITSKILKFHDSNSFIMTSLMCFMYYIVDIYKKDIVRSKFKAGSCLQWDQLFQNKRNLRHFPLKWL